MENTRACRVYSLADGKVSSARHEAIPEAKSACKASTVHGTDQRNVAWNAGPSPGQLPQAEDVGWPIRRAYVMYAAKEVRQGIRRATSTRIAEAAEAIDSYLAERQDVRVGNIARTHWGISHAHQPDDASVTLPESATFRKMQHLDATSASRHEGDREEGVYCTLTVILNSSRDMQLTFNIEELRAVIQLPKYSLIAEGLFSNFQPQLEPAVNMEDINHVSD
ncbi:hypothetical protein GQ600_10666 [Phytophthora cactorum]|nr:hypothetical protein GQ600_10666 [Phytophthora cactorum]